MNAKLLLVPLFLISFCAVFADAPPIARTEQDALYAYGRGKDSSHPGLQLVGTSLPEGPAGNGAGEAAARRSMEDYLQPGDVLLARGRLSPVPSLNPMNGWTHAAIYVGKGEIVVASNPFQDTARTSIRFWEYPYKTWVVCLRVTSATAEERKRAAEFAEGEIGRPYDLNVLCEQEDGPSWYCSELIWAAYLHATGGRVDLEGGLGVFGVSPDDIYKHPDTAVIGGHYERKPDTLLSLLAKVFILCALFGTAMAIRER